MASDDLTVAVDGKEYALDEFELGELEWLEEHIGAPLSDGAALSSMKAAIGLVYLIRKREDANYNYDDARKVKLKALNAPPAADERPTKARGKAAA